MSIQDGGGPISYSDHDVHHIRHNVTVAAGAGGDDLEQAAVEELEITERGLDPDELAELRAMHVSVGAVANGGEPQSQRGEFSFTVDAGFNIGENDGLFGGEGTATAFDPDGDDTDEIVSRIRDTDEVGQIYAFADNFSIGFDDDTNGNGGATSTSSMTETVNMSDLFGSGPYVDSADDFVSVINVEPDNVIERFGVEVAYSLYYNVEQVEGGRSRFGR